MALDQFLDAESRDTRNGERIDISVSGFPATVKTVTRPDAEAALRRLDLVLHPWGEPGVVPTVVGEYWATLNDGEASPIPVLLAGGKWFCCHQDWASDEEWVPYSVGSYRRRWTPEGPTPADVADVGGPARHAGGDTMTTDKARDLIERAGKYSSAQGLVEANRLQRQALTAICDVLDAAGDRERHDLAAELDAIPVDSDGRVIDRHTHQAMEDSDPNNSLAFDWTARPRDPARIPIVVCALEHLWRQQPDMRLGQLLANVTRGQMQDHFFIEDDVWLRHIEEATTAPTNDPLAAQDIKPAMEARDPAGHDEQRARDWLQLQQFRPDWHCPRNLTAHQRASWPVWEVQGDTGAIVVLWPGEEFAKDGYRVRPLIVAGMSVETKDGVIRASDMTQATFERVDGWQFWRFGEWSGEHYGGQERCGTWQFVNVGASTTEKWRPAAFAALDSEPAAAPTVVDADVEPGCNCDQVAELQRQLNVKAMEQELLRSAAQRGHNAVQERDDLRHHWHARATRLADALAEVTRVQYPRGKRRAELMALAESLGAESE